MTRLVFGYVPRRSGWAPCSLCSCTFGIVGDAEFAGIPNVAAFALLASSVGSCLMLDSLKDPIFVVLRCQLLKLFLRLSVLWSWTRLRKRRVVFASR